jgi:hypothetical protein
MIFENDVEQLMIASMAVDFDINCFDYDQMTLLHIAGDMGRENIFNWLLAHGANPEQEDRFGRLPALTVKIKLNLIGGSEPAPEEERVSITEDKGTSF